MERFILLENQGSSLVLVDEMGVKSKLTIIAALLGAPIIPIHHHMLQCSLCGNELVTNLKIKVIRSRNVGHYAHCPSGSQLPVAYQ